MKNKEFGVVSMKDISNACGVSIATVSKALNRQPDISKETGDYIRQTAKDMGYFPNSAAKALRTNRTHNLGVLFTDKSGSGLTHDYFAHILEHFKNAVEEKGYDITFINSCKSRSDKMSYLEHARYRGFDGVVIANVDFFTTEVEELIKSSIPVVTIDHLFPGGNAVISDNVNGMRDLVHYIYDLGHRRIAYLHGENYSVTQDRVSSFYETCEELGLSIPSEYVAEASYRDMEEAYAETEKLLDLKEPPTCILYPDDFSCFGGINAITERNLKIPGDISVAGYDGIRIAMHFKPSLTTVVQDTERIGREAAGKLISLIEKPGVTVAEQIIVPSRLFPGETVKKI